MNSKTSSDLYEEQLYMFEFLVDHVDLTTESIKRLEKSPICVRLKFIDLPVINLNQEEFLNPKKKKPSSKLKDKSKSTSIDFSIGKSCLFPKRPHDLVQALRSKPLKVGIYKELKKIGCRSEEEIPFCETKVLLSGCLCDQVIMSVKDRNNFPEPYVLKNTYNLIDNQGGPCGTITLFLRFTCFGKTIETQFALREKSFLFKNSQSPNEFQCDFSSSESEMKLICDYSVGESRALKPENVIGLMPICQELPLEKEDPKREIEKIAPKEEFKELFVTQCETFKEEDDANCCKSLTTIRPCDGIGCGETNLLFNDVRNPCDSGSDFCEDGSCRLRGGGCCTNNATDNSKPEKQKGIINNRIFTSFSSGKEPGGKLSMETLVSGACKSAWRNSATPNRTGCGCFGKGRGLNSGGTCSKMPCTGVDCFVRALKETQEFVDSLGKVPGLAGLGLMDPTESPYFGRLTEDVDTCQPRSKKSDHHLRALNTKSSAALPRKDSRTKGKKVDQTLPVNLNRSHPDIAKLHKQIKTHHKSRKKDVKGTPLYDASKLNQDVRGIETGPCGEPSCKSRRKKVADDKRSSTSSLKTDSKKDHPAESSTAIKLKNFSSKGDPTIKKRKKGPSKKHSETSRAPLIKVSRNLMKQIRSLRERNPGVVYGHRNCLDFRIRVPKNMGWLWNTRNVLGRPPPRIGWKPGAIDKYVYYLLKEAKDKAEELEEEEEKPLTPLKVKNPNSSRIGSLHSFGRSRRVKKETSNPEMGLPPTLHIHRKDGTYYITMYPIKEQNIAHPEMQQFVKPLQFKVTKEKEDDRNDDDSFDSSVSDMEIEFSPPAAITHCHPKPETKTIGTQLKQQDIFDTYKLPKSVKSAKIGK